jgi:hypothetical protein
LGPNVNPVVAVVIIIALIVFIVYISLPRLGPTPRFAINETQAVAALRTICNAQHLYHTRYKTYTTLELLLTEDAIRPELAKAVNPECAKNGYYFKVTLGEDQWSCVALPAKPGKSGKRSFFTDNTAVVRQAKCESAADPPAGPDSLTMD